MGERDKYQQKHYEVRWVNPQKEALEQTKWARKGHPAKKYKSDMSENRASLLLCRDGRIHEYLDRDITECSIAATH